MSELNAETGEARGAVGKDTYVPPKAEANVQPPHRAHQSDDGEPSAADDAAVVAPDRVARDEQVAGRASRRLGSLRSEDAHHVVLTLGGLGEIGRVTEGRGDHVDGDAGGDLDLADGDVGLRRPGDGAGGREDGEGVALGVQQVDGVGRQIADGGHDDRLSPPKWNGPRSSTVLLLHVLSTAFSLKMGYHCSL